MNQGSMYSGSACGRGLYLTLDITAGSLPSSPSIVELQTRIHTTSVDFPTDGPHKNASSHGATACSGHDRPHG